MSENLGKSALMMVKALNRFVVYRSDIDDDVTSVENFGVSGTLDLWSMQ